jgi:hypothetical protein
MIKFLQRMGVSNVMNKPIIKCISQNRTILVSQMSDSVTIKQKNCNEQLDKKQNKLSYFQFLEKQMIVS